MTAVLPVLSVEMARGAMTRCHVGGYVKDATKAEYKGCALQLANAFTGRTSTLGFNYLDYEKYPILAQEANDPVTGITRSVVRIIIDLNDKQKWDIARIIAWVEGCERALYGTEEEEVNEQEPEAVFV